MPDGQTFSPATPSRIERDFSAQAHPKPDPEVLIKLREKLPEINKAFDRNPEAATIRWQNIITQLNKLHSAIIMEGLEDDFDMNWQYGRILHNIGKPSDALAYLTKASELDDSNLKVQGRIIEVLLDLNAEMPNMTYEEPAAFLARELHNQEQSQYSLELYQRAQNAFNNPHAAYELEAA